MKLAVPTGFLLLLCLLPLSVLADSGSSDSPPSGQDQNVIDEVAKALSVQSIVLGGSYDQGTFKMFNGNTKAQLTDNGRTVPILD